LATDGRLLIRDLEADEMKGNSGEVQETLSSSLQNSSMNVVTSKTDSATRIDPSFRRRKRYREEDEVSNSDPPSETSAIPIFPNPDSREKRRRSKKETINDVIYQQSSIYRSKNARGDMKRPGRPDPFVYIPLDRKQRKRQQKTHNLIAAAQRGSTRGHLENRNLRKRRKS
jgi:hypothetical protein